MRTLVVDASVAIKWVVEEEGTAEALALRLHRLCAPDLLVAECANILWKKVRRRELDEAEALLAARLLERCDVELMPMRRMLGEATRLAMLLGHPAYDCLYLALAQSGGHAFVTADERLCARVAERELAVEVLTLSNAASSLDR